MHWIPLRWAIPLLLLFTATLSAVAFHTYEINQSIYLFEQTTQQGAFRNLSRAATFAEYLLQRHDTDGVSAELSGLATENMLETLALVTPENKVLFASHIAWIDSDKKIMSKELQALTEDTIKNRQGHAHFSKNRNLLYIHFPVLFAASKQAIRPNHYGALIATYNLSAGKQQIIHDVEQRLVLFIFIFMLLALIIWLISYFALTRRVHAIVKAAEAFAKGDFSARAKLTSPDELGRISTAFDAMAEHVQASVHDIAKLAGVVEHMVEVVFVTDADGSIEYINPAFTKVTGYSEAEAIGQNPRLIKSGKHSTEFYQALWSRISTGKVWQGRFTDKRKDGTLFQAKSSIVPIIDSDGEITHYVTVQEDITEQIENEKQLQHAMKMESLGTLVGGIAHEFNNRLAGMVGNLYLAKKHTNGMPKLDRFLDNIDQLNQRAANMIRQLLTFAHQDPVHFSPFNLAEGIPEAFNLIRVSIPANISIEQHIHAETLMIHADKTQIHQVLTNLLTNARHAVSDIEHPQISITLDHFKASPAFTKKHPNADEHYALLSIRDNGCGINEETIGRIFEPFFTTRNVGEGTGLGLSMVFRSVERHHGIIEVESSVSKGTEFKLYYPLLQHFEAPSELSTPEVHHSDHGERLLLADDEAVVRQSMKEVLELSGYQVVIASDGNEAVAAFSAAPESFNLIVLDIIMPNLGGVAAAKKMREIRPDIPIVFETGYDNTHLEEFATIANSVMLYKPVKPAKMKSVITNLLEKSSGKG